MRNIRQFTPEEVEAIPDVLLQTVQKNFMKGDTESGHVYEVTLREFTFRCTYSDDELKTVASLIIELFDMIMERISEGLDQKALDQMLASCQKIIPEDDTKELITTLSYVKYIMNEEMENLYIKIAHTMRVDGAHLFLVAGPAFQSAIYSCYDILLRAAAGEQIIDNMDNIEIQSVYFLFRATMRMNSDSL